jgi:hypothetical protein
MKATEHSIHEDKENLVTYVWVPRWRVAKAALGIHAGVLLVAFYMSVGARPVPTWLTLPTDVVDTQRRRHMLAFERLVTPAA